MAARVLQIVAAMNCGGIENDLMSIYRHIDEMFYSLILYHFAGKAFLTKK